MIPNCTLRGLEGEDSVMKTKKYKMAREKRQQQNNTCIREMVARVGGGRGPFRIESPQGFVTPDGRYGFPHRKRSVDSVFSLDAVFRWETK